MILYKTLHHYNYTTKMLNTLLKLPEKTVGQLTGTCMTITFAVFGIAIMLKGRSIEVSDSRSYKIQTGCGVESLTSEEAEYNHDSRAKINPWTAHRLELIDLSIGGDPSGRDELPYNVYNFVNELENANESNPTTAIFEEMLKSMTSFAHGDNKLPFHGKPVLQLIPSTNFIRSKNEVVSSYSDSYSYSFGGAQAKLEESHQYILTGDFLGRFHDQHWGNASWFPHYSPQIFFELPEWEISKIANETTHHSGNITGHLFSKHASTDTPRYQQFTFNGQLRKVQNITEMRSKNPVKDTSKFDVLKLTDDLTFNKATQPLCMKSLNYYENLDTSLTQCYIQDNLQLTMPHPIKSIYREKRDAEGKPLNIQFGEMLGGNEMLLARLSPGYCYDFPETYSKHYTLDIDFKPLIVCKDQANTTISTVDADGTGITASEWFVFGTAVRNDLDICYFNFPFYVIPETEAKVEPIFVTNDMLENEIYPN